MRFQLIDHFVPFKALLRQIITILLHSFFIEVLNIYRKVRDAKESGERKEQALKDKLDATVSEYETQIENLQSKMSQMEDEIENKNQSCTRMYMYRVYCCRPMWKSQL